jgi:hypothetical protein
MEVAATAGVNPQHRALFYRTIDEYASAVADFLLNGDALAQPAFIAVPHDRHAKLWHALKPRLRGASAAMLSGSPGMSPATAVASAPARTTFADMSELGRNPARIIPVIQAFVDRAAGGPARFVGEPIWPGRTAAEMREGTRHEALINLAFAGTRRRSSRRARALAGAPGLRSRRTGSSRALAGARGSWTACRACASVTVSAYDAGTPQQSRRDVAGCALFVVAACRTGAPRDPAVT